MFKEDLALNNLQWLICHKTQPNQTKHIFIQCVYIKRFFKHKINEKNINTVARLNNFIILLVYFVPDIGIMVRVFTNGSRDLGLIPG